MLERIKRALDLTSDARDKDVEECIDACLFDLNRVGVKIFDDCGCLKLGLESDPLIVQAVKLYARWMFNYEDAAYRYKRSYDSLRDALALCGDYNA